MNEIPVYLFTGFMDSGKTTLVKETLFDDGFTEGGRSVVICCEDGDVEYDEEEKMRSMQNRKRKALQKMRWQEC